MSEDYTGHAVRYLRENPEWLTDARRNAPLLIPTICGTYLSRRFSKPYKQMEQHVYKALVRMNEE